MKSCTEWASSNDPPGLNKEGPVPQLYPGGTLQKEEEVKANGKTKQPRTPIFEIDGQEFVILCGRFVCDGHQTAVTLGESPELVCKRTLTFTGETAPVLMAGTPSTLNGVCPILLIEEDL